MLAALPSTLLFFFGLLRRIKTQFQGLLRGTFFLTAVVVAASDAHTKLLTKTSTSRDTCSRRNSQSQLITQLPGSHGHGESQSRPHRGTLSAKIWSADLGARRAVKRFFPGLFGPKKGLQKLHTSYVYCSVTHYDLPKKKLLLLAISTHVNNFHHHTAALRLVSLWRTTPNASLAHIHSTRQNGTGRRRHTNSPTPACIGVVAEGST